MTEQSASPAGTRGPMPAPDDFSREPEKPLFALLDRLGIRTTTTTHAKVFTVAESQLVKADLPGGHTKNLFMKDKTRPARSDLGALDQPAARSTRSTGALGTQRLSFTDAPILWEALGRHPRLGHRLCGDE